MQEEGRLSDFSSGGDERLLPEAGVKELSDRVTEYMTRIEQFEISDVLQPATKPLETQRRYRVRKSKWCSGINQHVGIEFQARLRRAVVADESVARVRPMIVEKPRRWALTRRRRGGRPHGAQVLPNKA